MKLLIVDDEELLRLNIKNIVQASKLKFTSISMASNTLEAIDIINQDAHEIILTDIRMPQKSGLDLAKYVYENHPEYIVIFITGYSDFEYAREGIQYNVFDYILKPVNPTELIASIEKAQDKFNELNKQKKFYSVFRNYYLDNYDQIRKQFFENLLFRPISYNESQLQFKRDYLSFNFDYYRLVLLRCRSFNEYTVFHEEYYYAYTIEKYFKEKVPESVTCAIEDVVYLFFPEKADIDTANLLIKLLNELHAFLEDKFSADFSAGISCRSQSLLEIKELKEQSQVCLRQCRDNQNLFYDEIADLDGTAKNGSNISDLLTQFYVSVSTSNNADAIKNFQDILGLTRKMPNGYIISILNLVISTVSLSLYEIGVESEKILTLCKSIKMIQNTDYPVKKIEDSIKLMIDNACYLIKEAKQNKKNFIIKNVYDYINNNYSKQISLSDAAFNIGRNPSYLSRIIKQSTGKGFTEILTEKRINESKKLLKDTNLKIAEISKQVGYPNQRYFNRLFSDHVSISPNEYRKIISNVC